MVNMMYLMIGTNKSTLIIKKEISYLEVEQYY